MVEPSSRVAPLSAVDNAAIVQIKEEGVAIVPIGLLVLASSFFPRNKFSTVFDYELARLDGGRSKDTSTVNGRISDGNAAHSRQWVGVKEDR